MPLMVIVASGEPGVPLICWAHDEEVVMVNAAHMAPTLRMIIVLFISPFCFWLLLRSGVSKSNGQIETQDAEGVYWPLVLHVEV